ncbi:MAG: 30S ribosomal protein S20 [Rubellimicrobium sp.]|nr:30S ribosomal protein S20 [Rubellimicrobium sp.]
MANSLQSAKRARQSAKRQDINKMRKSRIRTYLRRVEEAIASGDQDRARDALRDAQPELMRGVTRGLFHKNTAARKMSRLSARVKAMGAVAA